MNLYACVPVYAPNAEVEFILAASDEEAMGHGVFVAANDVVSSYGSPAATVFLIAANVQEVGVAYATEAPASWEWAHPAVEENAAAQVCAEAEFDFEQGGGAA